jgi:glycosyltransferase involved in cell wall biosynthesis
MDFISQLSIFLAGRSTTVPQAGTRLNEKIVVVIPTLDEECGIQAVIESIRKYYGRYRYDVLVVDAHSRDRTVEVAKKCGAKVIYQSGRGYGDALNTGLFYALEHLDPTILVTMDGDGTYDVEDSTKLINSILEGKADYAIGNRLRGKMMKQGVRFYGNKLISWLTCKLLKLNIEDTQSGMIAFRSRLVGSSGFKTKGWGINTEMAQAASVLGMRIAEIPIRYHPRLGRSKLNPIRAGLVDLGVATRIMRDTEPLLLFGSIGTVFLLVGLVFGIDVAHEFALTGVISRAHSAVFSALTLIFGLQLLSLGIITDMLKVPRRVQFFEEA